ncbi:MAG: hypothetical protein ACREIV_16425, partial [Planctomycetaceae bacterium]
MLVIEKRENNRNRTSRACARMRSQTILRPPTAWPLFKRSSVAAFERSVTDWQIFLNLSGDARFGQLAPTVRTGRRQRHINRLVDRRRRSSMGVSAVPTTRSPTGPTRLSGRCAFRKRRRLTLTRAARRLKRLGQPLNFAPQSLALGFEPRILVAQSITFILRVLNLAAQPLHLSLGIVDRLRHVASRHATVMADSRKKYNPKLRITPDDPLTSYNFV